MRSFFSLLALLVLFGCGKKPEIAADGHQNLGAVSERLKESSGLVASVSNPGLLWTLNDSGNPAEVFLIDTLARIKMTCKVQGVDNRDWEDMVIGAGPDSTKSYVYVGDIGDNLAVYPYKYVYRFAEPVFTGTEDQPVTEVEKFVVVLPDGKRDSETLMIDPATHDLYIVSKREPNVNVYRSKYPFTSDTLRPEKVLTLPLTQITSASISSDSQQVLLRNYNKIYYWKRAGEKTLPELLARKPIELPYDPENQGEAISWNRDGSGFFTLSESPEVGPTSQLRYYPRP